MGGAKATRYTTRRCALTATPSAWVRTGTPSAGGSSSRGYARSRPTTTCASPAARYAPWAPSPRRCARARDAQTRAAQSAVASARRRWRGCRVRTGSTSRASATAQRRQTSSAASLASSAPRGTTPPTCATAYRSQTLWSASSAGQSAPLASTCRVTAGSRR